MASFSNQINRVLLYSENLTEQFFDLSPGEAGAILQTFRNYGVRVAVVCSPGVRLSWAHRCPETGFKEIESCLVA